MTKVLARLKDGSRVRISGDGEFVWKKGFYWRLVQTLPPEGVDPSSFTPVVGWAKCIFLERDES